MSHYLIEQLAALAERRGAHRHAGRRRPRARTATCAACACAARDGEESTLEVDACFVFIGASPRTDWLEGVVARDERGFILAGPDAQADGWPLKRDPYLLETTVPGRVRRRRRPRALDQARRQRRRRGLDGRLADPPVPGRRHERRAVTLAELRTVDLFDDLDDEQLGEWLVVATVRRARAGDPPGGARPGGPRRAAAA